MLSHITYIVSSLAFGLSVLATSQPAVAGSYTVTDLGTLGGNESRAYEVNDLAHVAGEAKTTGGDMHAFLWLPEPAYGLPAGMTDLGTLGGNHSAAFGVNNEGQVVGRADSATPGVYHAFIWDAQNGMQDLGTLGGQVSEAYAINDLGDVVGRAQNADGVFRAFYRWSEGLMEWVPLILPGEQESAGFAIGYGNLHMAGASSSGPSHAFAFGGEAGLYVLEDLGFGSAAYGLDGLRRVGSVTLESSAEHAAFWHILAFTDLGTLGGVNSRAYAINDFDQIVGESDTTTGVNHAFLREGGAMTDLNDLLPANSGWALNEARDINENGVIVGTGTIKGQTHAFLLWATSTVAGQSVNIDYGEGAGTPPSDYAAAGSPGVWNALSGPRDTPEALVGLDGLPIAATVTLTSGAGGPPRAFDDPGTFATEEQLLDDYTSGGTDAVGSIFFSGLENGLYEVIVYAWTPGSPDVFTSVWEDCAHIISFLIGGSWPGDLEDGITHARFVKTVVDGTMQVCTAGGIAWEGAINGIQLVALNCNYGSGGTCTLPPDPGPCDGSCPRFYYDTCTEQCEPFTWGCCLGNANNFETIKECAVACPNPTSIDKNRYLSFKPDEPGPVAYKLDMVSSLFHPTAVVSGWVGVPDANGIAALVLDPVTRMWIEPVVNITGCEITPVAEFELAASTDEGQSFLPPVSLRTIPQPGGGKFWGDACGTFDGNEWSAPQGVTNVDDAVCALKTWQGAPGAPEVPRTDMEPQEPNRVVNINDVLFIIFGFRGDLYPFGCPDDPCQDNIASPCP